MKPVNLYYLSCHPENVPAARVENVMSSRPAGLLMREAELQDCAELTRQLMAAGASIQALAGFFCSFTIGHIGKEFDLLKVVSRKRLINIEIKSRDKKPDDMFEQLRKNYYYLRVLGLPMYLFAWLESTGQLFILDGDRLQEIKMEQLAVLLNQSARLKYEQDLDRLFVPELYLVSPMNSPKRFLQSSYFLTAHQTAMKKEILQQKPVLWAVYGEAGTGKTLFLLDLARTLAKTDPVLYLHNGQLHPAHRKISDAIDNLTIRSRNSPGSLQEYTHILVDDAQRLDPVTLQHILARLQESQGRGLFGYDPSQVLTWQEKTSPVLEWLTRSGNLERFRLTRRIRCNASLAAFASAMFEPSRTLPKSVCLDDLQCLYARTISEARAIHDAFYQAGYMTISYGENLDFCAIQGLTQGEALLGQEYEKVLVIADKRFVYQKGRLVSLCTDPVYIQEKLLYQGIARTRKSLCILCLDNPELYTVIFGLQHSAGITKNT